MAFQLSPGVLVTERDLTSIIPAVATSIGAFAGTFAWGPVLDPTLVTSENQLVARFGKPNNSNFKSFFTAANFLSYSNNMQVVRVQVAAARNAVVTPSGTVTGITINNGGSGYNSTTVLFTSPQQVGGVTATGTAVLAKAVDSVAVTDGGTGYTALGTTVTFSAPQLADGVTAEGTVTVAGGVITEIVITEPGSGYTSAPTVTLTGDGADAVLGTVTMVDGIVYDVNITNPGSGYTSAPTASIAGGIGFVSTASITVGGLRVNNEDEYTTNYANGAGLVGEFAAKYPGALGNSIGVSIADAGSFTGWAYEGEFDDAPGTSSYAASVGGEDDELHLIVVDSLGLWTGIRGAILEKFAFMSKASDARKSDGTNNYYRDVINNSSKYLWWMDHPTGKNWGGEALNKSYDLLAGTEPITDGAEALALTGGVDAFNADDGDYQDGYALFQNAELYDISLIPTGGVSPAVAKWVVENVVEGGTANNPMGRRDCVVFISPVDVTTGEVITGPDSAEKMIEFRTDVSFNVNSSYAVLDSGYKYQYDRYNDVYRWVPLNGDIAGLCARTDYTNDPWWSPGGLNRGQIKNVVKLAFNPNKAERDELYKNGINPVVSFPGQGVVLFGDKTLLSRPSAFDRINVRRLFIVLEKAIATAAKYQLFEFNDDFTRAQFKAMVEPFLRDVQGRRGIYDFRVKCDDTNNTGEVIDRNEFVADIYIKPARSINFITLNFIAARTGISFDEIGA